jgi:hypothetical protein
MSRSRTLKQAKSNHHTSTICPLSQSVIPNNKNPLLTIFFKMINIMIPEDWTV